MKILNPQSAILPNAEVLHFLQTHPLRPPDKTIGSYIPTSRSGHETIRRDLLAYFQEVTPWTSTLTNKLQAESYLDPQDTVEVYDKKDGCVRVLLERLAKYELTKGEVLMIVNLGLGLEDWPDRMPPRLRGGGDGVQSAEEQRASDEWVLAVVCEELEERFGPEEIRGILETVGQVLRQENGKGNAGDGEGGPVADRAHKMVSEWRSKQRIDGVDEDEDADVVIEEDKQGQPRGK